MAATPQVPPPQTQIVDANGRMTKEFYDYLLRLAQEREMMKAQIKALQEKVG